MLVSSHHVLLPQGAAAVPDWVHLVPAGTFRGVDGRGPFTLKDAQAVITASMANGARLPIDENHATDLAAKTGQPSPARGWIVAMRAEADGIHAQIEWNEAGKALMSDKAYNGISPVFLHDKAGVISQVLRAALTNTPNLADLAKLNHQQETGMDLAALRKALGLADTADEAAVLAAVTANAQAVARHSQQLSAIATAAGLDASLAPDGLVTALQAQQAAGNPSDMARQIVSLQTELGTLRKDRAREKAEAFVDAAIKGGKPINPLRDHFIARHMADPAAVEKEVNALPSINAGGVPTVVLNAQGQPDADAPTAAEKTVADKMGIDPKKLVEQRKKRESGGNG